MSDIDTENRIPEACVPHHNYAGMCEFGTRGCARIHIQDVVAGELPMDWQIEECIELLLSDAWRTGVRLNEGRLETGRPLAPRAYQATNSYHAIEIILALKRELNTARLENLALRSNIR